MANIDQTEATALLAASLKNTAYTPASTWFVALNTTTTNPTATVIAASTAEVSGGSYARQAVAFNTPSAGATANTSTISFTSMPVATVHSIEIFSASTGTTRRLWYGLLTADKTTASGDILSFNSGAIAVSLG